MVKMLRKLLALVALVSGTAAWADDSGWTISQADGQVSITRDGKAIYGAVGTVLQIGDVVHTSKAARAVLARGNEFFIVSPDARVRIAREEDSGTVAQIFQFLGDMLSSETDQPDLKRPVMAAVVKGYGRGLDGNTFQSHEDGEPEPSSEGQ